MGKLEGQVAVVFGASSGMGYAAARLFAQEGAKVLVAARRQDQLSALAEDIARRGGEALAMAADVSVRQTVEAAIEAAVTRWGRLDVVINTAGINAPNRRLEVLTQETWDRIVGVNLTGAFHITQAALPQMRRQQNGLIIHVTSVSGKWGDFSGAAYQASKHGMVGLAYATMVEERLNGIRVTLIFPGLVDTPILNNRPVPPTQEMRDKMMKPEDIAAACLFVASLPPRTYVPEIVMLPGALQCVGQTAV